MRVTPRQLLIGFVAGFLAVLIFHQGALTILSVTGTAPISGYNFWPVRPLGLPAVILTALWGGVWGIAFTLAQPYFPRDGGYWGAALAFGALLPSLVALLIVLPIKGGPVGAGWRPEVWLFAFLVNGAWGIGTGLFLRLAPGRPGLA